MEFFKKIFAICDDPEEDEIESKAAGCPPELEEIRDQMEFYFSPSNVSNDAFMKEQISQREDRYVSVDVFMKFNRIKQLHGTPETIIEACKYSDELDVNEKGTMIRSHVPYVDDPRRQYRTLHIEGFDVTETLDTLRKLFREAFPCKVLRIDMRKKNAKGGDKLFSGAVNVELADEDVCAEFAEKGFEYNGKELQVQLFSDFKRALNDRARRPQRKEAPKKEDPVPEEPKVEESKEETKIIEVQEVKEEEETEEPKTPTRRGRPKKSETPRRSPRKSNK